MDRRPSKRLRTATYHDRVDLTDDFEVVHARETVLRQHTRLPVDTPRSPQKGRTTWTHGNSWVPEDSFEFALDPDGDWYDEQVEQPILETTSIPAEPPSKIKKRKKKSKVSRRPHVVWKEGYRSLYLDEMIRWEGRGDMIHEIQCRECRARGEQHPGLPEFRCLDCFLPDLTCRGCCVKRHHTHPLHVIEQWDGVFFKKVSLQSLGLRIQLGHVSMRCSNPVPGPRDFQIMHTNSIHDVNIDYCGCERAEAKHVQLLRRGIYPATQITIKTSASFRLLSLLHLHSLASKGSTYDFYRMLERLTNNTGLQVPKSRYRALLRIFLQWRHLKMLKRGGRGHELSGVAGTRDGQLAIECPSCPHPGKNLLPGWENVDAGSRFLYTLFLCMDANFRLKNQLVSNYSTDPGLGIGMAYFVPRSPYESYVLSRADSEEVSTCVGFAAIAKATTTFSRGLRYTGVGAVSCGRSEMIMPNGVGNLQKGERYANMDYIFASAIRFTQLLIILISYDIVCQWFVNFWKRATESFPQALQPPSNVILRPHIPKLHEPAHQKKDHARFSFNLSPGVGLTDGECPERIWALHNGLGNTTKNQGPGSRHDVLDDHFGFWNWLKYIGMGNTLIRRYKVAVRDRNLQAESHRGFTATIASSAIVKWEALCIAWEVNPHNKSVESPYEVEEDCLSEAEVRRELAQLEADRLSKNGIAMHTTSLAAFLSLGLELEESQRRLKRLAKGGDAVPGLGTSLTEQRNALCVRIRAWEPIRAIYMPGLLQFQMDTTTSSPNSTCHPEDEELWLPSRIPADRWNVVCHGDLPMLEDKLWTAQCQDSLEGLRNVIRLKTRMVQFKNKQVRGQREGTRSRTLIDRVHNRARGFAEKYRAARQAKLQLVGSGIWEQSLRVLLDSDIRSYSETPVKQHKGRKGTLEDDALEQEERTGEGVVAALSQEDEEPLDLRPQPREKRDGTGQTRKEISWIWRSTRIASADVGPQADKDDHLLRSEWAKSRARVARATEEVALLREEMRRTLAYLQWKTEWWLARQKMRVVSDQGLAEGLRAYASEQASIQSALSSNFQRLWQTPLEMIDESPQKDEWPNNSGPKGDDADGTNGKDSDDDIDSDGDIGESGDDDED